MRAHIMYSQVTQHSDRIGSTALAHSCHRSAGLFHRCPCTGVAKRSGTEDLAIECRTQPRGGEQRDAGKPFPYMLSESWCRLTGVPFVQLLGREQERLSG